MPKRPSGKSEPEVTALPAARRGCDSPPAAAPGWEVFSAGPAHNAAPLADAEIAGRLNAGGWEWRSPALLVVNDSQRPTPTARILSLLDPPPEAWPRARFIVAAGSHAPPGEPELEEIFGPRLYGRIRERVLVHDARGGGFVRAGRTSRGVEVAVNHLLFEAEVLVAVGSVEPHYFAGYTGGRKSIVPGLAAFESIRGNHRLALEPEARILALAGNPLHLDLEEGCRIVLEKARRGRLRDATAVSAVARGGEIFFLDRGAFEGAVERAAPAADALFVREVGARFPVVVAVAGEALDRDFYQALKAFEHGRQALAAGGTLILVARCDRGCGPAHFTRLLSGAGRRGWCPDPLEGGYELGQHKLINLVSFLGAGNRLFLVSTHRLPEVEGMGIPCFCGLEEAVARAAAAAGGSTPRRLLRIEEATSVVPRVAPGAAGSAPLEDG